MPPILRESWTLFVGVFLLMLGNGLQATLLGVRGAMEGMSPSALSWVMSAFFFGLLIGARVTPNMVAKVGHVRVFAALSSLISAGFILYAMAPDPWVWAATRFVIGFCFCGVYVVSESWLNDISTNKTRGKLLSAYMLAQTFGVIAAQGLLNLADPGGYALFAVISVAVSLSMTPMLLAATRAPTFETATPMTLRKLLEASPLGCVTVFLVGGLFSALFGMTGVYGVAEGLSVGQISALMAAIYAGGLITQLPIGWLSDRFDRRLLLIGTAILGGSGAAMGVFAHDFWSVLVCGALVGGSANPLYALALAYTNDYLERDQMAAASGGLLFINAIGAVGGPVVVGFAMQVYGPEAFFGFIALVLAAIALYGFYRMTQRASLPIEETGDFEAQSPVLSPVVFEVEEAHTVPESEAQTV